MSKEKYIFISPAAKEFFISDVKDRVEKFRYMRSYGLASGEIDYQSLDNDRQDLIDDGWRLVPSPQYIHIKLYYMKDSGKYYSEGELVLNRGEAEAEPAKSWMDTMDKIRYLLDSGNLPGLVKGARYEVFVTGEGHPGGYPQLFRINN
ncbi:hypothetical protein P3446_13295 [Escherichia coli]|uniref:hypothetical protein n=1 Tax=Escherichia coli TaxID=562 RepID=UPI0023ED0EA8|nr:hypothetical protein [Escherichia coli]MDF4164726.1 hypothetical protein [Escherichia coli]